MVDVSCIVMAATNNHDLPAEKEHGRWRQGEVVSVFLFDLKRTDYNEPRFYVIHITGCPGTFRQIAEWLTEFHRAPDVVGKAGIVKGALHAQRKRVIDFSEFTPTQWLALKTARQITTTWQDICGVGSLSLGVNAKARERTEQEKPTDKGESDQK